MRSQVLLRDKHLRPGGLAIPQETADFGAWASTFGNRDPEVKGLLLLRREALARIRQTRTASGDQLRSQTELALQDPSDLLPRNPLNASELRDQTTAAFLALLQKHLPGDEAQWGTLKDEIRQNWFSHLRMAFRSALQRDEQVRSTFQVQVWEQVAGIAPELAEHGKKLDNLLVRLDTFDSSRDELSRQVTWLVEAVEAVANGLNAQHKQGREDLASLPDAIERDPGVQKASESLNTLLQRLADRLDHLIGGLTIERFELPDPPRHDRELLLAGQRIVPLLGRKNDLNSLWDWLFTGENISARLIVGGAGTGKTRLAFELLLRVYDQVPDWKAGLVSSENLHDFLKDKSASDLHWTAPTLLVVDYAQPSAAALGRLLKPLAHRRNGQDHRPRLRILLLYRQAGGWFDHLLQIGIGESRAARPVGDLFHPCAPVSLTPLPPGELRRQVLDHTLRRAAELNQVAPLHLPPEGQRDFEASLARDLFAEPLNLMLAALVALEQGLLPALSRTRIELAEFLAIRERRRLARFAPKTGNPAQDLHPAQERLLLHLAACATLERGFTVAELDRATREEMEALRLAWPDGAGDLARVLKEALSGKNLPVAPIEPDFLGEAFLLAVLADPTVRGERIAGEAGPPPLPAAATGIPAPPRQHCCTPSKTSATSRVTGSRCWLPPMC